ncbi:hypothetical protein DEDE109153_15430 [Deinococcus deserti]
MCHRPLHQLLSIFKTIRMTSGTAPDESYLQIRLDRSAAQLARLFDVDSRSAAGLILFRLGTLILLPPSGEA